MAHVTIWLGTTPDPYTIKLASWSFPIFHQTLHRRWCRLKLPENFRGIGIPAILVHPDRQLINRMNPQRHRPNLPWLWWKPISFTINLRQIASNSRQTYPISCFEKHPLHLGLHRSGWTSPFRLDSTKNLLSTIRSLDSFKGKWFWDLGCFFGALWGSGMIF